MLIREFTETPDLDGVDLIEDLHFFMHNDPAFYRRVLFPAISKLRDCIKTGKDVKDDMFKNCVDNAADIYCKKFNIHDNPKSVFTDVDRDSLARKIFAQEQERIVKGDYDGRDE